MQQLPFSQVNRILIRSANWIGDAVMSTPAIAAVRSNFPEADITVVAPPLVSELFRFHPDCDSVIVFDKKGVHRGVRGMLKFCRQLRGRSFDMAVLLQNAIEAAIMACFAGISLRIGYRTDGRGFLLSHSVPVGKNEHKLHHTRYYQNMLETIGIVGEREHLNLACTSEEIAWALNALGGENVAAINPGATYGSAKRWYPGRFAKVADQLHEHYGLKSVLIGSPEEMSIGREIEAEIAQPCFNLVGKTTVRQMMAVLSASRLLVTNDSGPMHVAAAFGIPIVALFGPTDHTTTSPLSPHVRIVRKDVFCSPCLLRHCPIDHRCMKRIEVNDVMQAVHNILQNLS